MNSKEAQSLGFATRAVHGGYSPDPVTGAVSPSIVTSTTFAAEFGEIGYSDAETDKDKVDYVYAREGHPNSRQLERRLALLENGEAALVFSTGISAISGLMLHLLDPGDHIIITDISYAGTAEFTRGLLRRKGVDVTLVDLSDLSDLRSALRPSTKMIYAETPCNPILKLVDISAVSEVARDAKIQFVVDSTFASAVAQRPLELGADFVIHSLTKYYGGHGDSLGGVVIGKADAIEKLETEVGIHLGGSLSPFNAWLIMRGIETLCVRMAAYSETATKVATHLEAHPFVKSVRFPGLKSHPQYDLAQVQMALPGGMIAFTVQDTQAFGKTLKDTLKIFSFATSLGLSRSLILHCDTNDIQRTTFQLDEDHLRRFQSWAGDGFFRLSIGLEDAVDLCADLSRALDASAKAIGQSRNDVSRT